MNILKILDPYTVYELFPIKVTKINSRVRLGKMFERKGTILHSPFVRTLPGVLAAELTRPLLAAWLVPQGPWNSCAGPGHLLLPMMGETSWSMAHSSRCLKAAAKQRADQVA